MRRIALVKGNATAKFDETVEVALNLGVDPRHADQMVRGVVNLPKGTGKDVRVAVFAKGAKADEATAAGADVVGAEDLMETIQGGTIDFDRVIATPDMMGVVGRLGKVLGPKGLMPNPKLGTVTMDVTKAVTDAKSGQVEFRVEKAGIVHAGIGKASFSEADLKENFTAFMDAIVKNKPSGAKGKFVKKVRVSSSMGPGVKVDLGVEEPERRTPSELLGRTHLKRPEGRGGAFRPSSFRFAAAAATSPHCVVMATVFGSDRPLVANFMKPSAERACSAARAIQPDKRVIPCANISLPAQPRLRIAAPAAATNDNSGYVGVEGGILFPKSQTSRARSTSPTLRSADFARDERRAASGTRRAMDVDLIGGYDFGMFRLEGELGYKHAKAKSFNLGRHVRHRDQHRRRHHLYDDERLRPQRLGQRLFGDGQRPGRLRRQRRPRRLCRRRRRLRQRQAVRRQQRQARLAADRRRLHAGQPQPRYRPEVSLLPRRLEQRSQTSPSRLARRLRTGRRTFRLLAAAL